MTTIAESVGAVLAGVAAVAMFDYAYTKYETKRTNDAHQAFLKANPAVAAFNANGLPLAPMFPQDPAETPEALASRRRTEQVVLLAVPFVWLMGGLLLTKFTEHSAV